MDPRVKAVIGIMVELVADQASVRTLSRSINLSPSRLRQLFKKETGRSPMQYLRVLRMKKAEHLLRSTFLSVKEVAFLSGGKDASHFVRDFKKHCGLTPTEFRAQNELMPKR